MSNPKFQIGDAVYKWTGDYTGPGIVRGIAMLANGKVRYLVGHKIEGGTGEFLHVYADGNLFEVEARQVGGVLEFAQAILHGDDEHRKWLLEAATAFVSGQALPPPRSKS